jgi:hypothetical protein
VRLVGVSAPAPATVCRRILALHAAELLAGAIITATPGRLRIQMPEPPSE